MKKLSNRVKVSSFSYRLNRNMLHSIALRLSEYLPNFIQEIHKQGTSLKGNSMPAYKKNYAMYKARKLGVPESSLIPNLELTGELHGGAYTIVTSLNNGYDIHYFLSRVGLEHLLSARTNSKRVWDRYNLITRNFWYMYLLPNVEETMDMFIGKMLEKTDKRL